MDYRLAIRSAGLAALSSTVCVRCYVHSGANTTGDRTPFFGVKVDGPLNGRPTINGTRPKDFEFQKAVWKAAKNHVREAHGLQVVHNGAGGWKTVKA